MPLVYQQNINESTKVAVWYIVEQESFFLQKVTLHRAITHPHKRLQHLAGRYLLKEIFPDFPYELLRIADTKKPFLENEAYHFSISHCGNYAAVIVSRNNRVGVDIELFNEKIANVSHKFLSEQEHKIIDGLQEACDKTRLLTVAWSIKESMYKWYGRGEVDFSNHMKIDYLSIAENKGFATCRFLKEMNKRMTAEFLFFNGNCVSWVLTDH